MRQKPNPFEASPLAFISYARADGAELASSLRVKLEQKYPEITLWLDRAQMLGGIGWWKQITEALDKVELIKTWRESRSCWDTAFPCARLPRSWATRATLH